MRMQYRSFPFEVKAIDETEGTFEGYASVYGNIDSHESIIEKGAFTKTLKENRARVKVLWNHNPDEPIGRPLEMKSDGIGLQVKGKISETTRGKDVLILMRDKVITELSFGFDTIQDKWENGVRHIKEVRLWEFSPVTWASNELAAITAVRERFPNIERRDFDADFDQALLRQTPFMLLNTFSNTLDNALYGGLQPDEKYQELHTALSQFDEHFAQWIEDAYAAMSQRAFVFVKEERSLPELTEPEVSTPEEREAEPIPDESFVNALKELTENLKQLKEV